MRLLRPRKACHPLFLSLSYSLIVQSIATGSPYPLILHPLPPFVALAPVCHLVSRHPHRPQQSRIQRNETHEEKERRRGGHQSALPSVPGPSLKPWSYGFDVHPLCLHRAREIIPSSIPLLRPSCRSLQSFTLPCSPLALLLLESSPTAHCTPGLPACHMPLRQEPSPCPRPD